jgi:hypothetical protein
MRVAALPPFREHRLRRLKRCLRQHRDLQDGNLIVAAILFGAVTTKTSRRFGPMR